MPDSPQRLATMLRLIGVIQGPWDKNRVVMQEAGGRPPVTGPMGGGGGGNVTQMPSRAQMGHDAETARRIAERQKARGVTPDQAAYELELARRRSYHPARGTQPSVESKLQEQFRTLKPQTDRDKYEAALLRQSIEDALRNLPPLDK